MLSHLKQHIERALESSLGSLTPPVDPCPSVVLEKTKDKAHGDFSSNVAMLLAKTLKRKPCDIAEDIVKAFHQQIVASSLKDQIKDVQVRAPGFINIFLSNGAYIHALDEILEQGGDYGRTHQGEGVRVQIEFVSANPTGPLTVAHARQAAVGDALTNILRFLGFDVQKEYYINDEGNQIRILGRSIKLRAQEILGETIIFPDDHYQGRYIIQMAKVFLRDRKIDSVGALEKIEHADFERFGVGYLLDLIKKDLEDFGVHFDVWSSQAQIATSENIAQALDVIKAKGYLYDQDGALWFQSTQLGDDKDRVVKKSDGNYTYLAPDIAYHKNKFDRGFHKVINILGPDHHGYIGRLKAAVEALGHQRDDVDVLIVQLATLFRKGQPVSMSTRQGEFISLREVMDEVGSDAARFFFLMRHIKVHLEFDLDLAKQQTQDNPVYYIQYAHARINSIFLKAQEAGLKTTKKKFSRLVEPEEIDLIQKMASFEDALSMCLGQMDPFAMVSYLMDLAKVFHRFYDQHKVIVDDTALASQRLGLIEAARIVFHNGLALLGVSVPDKM